MSEEPHKKPYKRRHSYVKGEVAGHKEPSYNMGCPDINKACNAFFRKRGMPVREHGESYLTFGRRLHSANRKVMD